MYLGSEADNIQMKSHNSLVTSLFEGETTSATQPWYLGLFPDRLKLHESVNEAGNVRMKSNNRLVTSRFKGETNSYRSLAALSDFQLMFD